MSEPSQSEQEIRWAKSIEGLVERLNYIPQHEVLKPVYTMANGHRCWQIRLSDGRMAWAAKGNGYYDSVVSYFLPPDVAADCKLKWLIASGITQEFARTHSGAFLVEFELELILSVTPERWAELDREVREILESPL